MRSWAPRTGALGRFHAAAPDVLEEVRRGAEPFRRALSLAQYIDHHSLKERDMR